MPAPTGYSLSASQTFTGSSLPSPWQRGYYFSNTVPSSAVTVSGGTLKLTWARGGVSDISVSSTQTYSLGTGKYFEVRMKWTVSPGAWPAFWMIPTNGAGMTGEIDIFEGQGNDSGAYFATLHQWNGSSQLWQSSPNRFPVSVDYSQFHTYGLKWEAGRMTWYLDGQVITSISGYPSIFDTQSVFPILSMQEGNNWNVGNLSGVSVSSLTNEIEYFNVYTPGTPALGSPTISSFTASPTSVSPGGSSTLAWTTSGADTLSIDNGVGTVTGTSTSVDVNANTTYTLTAHNGVGDVTATATVSITTPGGSGSTSSGGGTGGAGGSAGGTTSAPATVPVISSFTTSDATISPGDSVTLSFSVSGATALSISPDVGTVTGTSVTVSPTGTTTFTLVAFSSAGSTTESVTVSVPGAAAENIRYHQIRRNDREGDGSQIQMSAPANPGISGWPAHYDDTNNVIARQPRGNTTVVQLADQTGGWEEGHVLVFDRYGNAKSGAGYPVVTDTRAGGTWVTGETPIGTLDGVNTTFAIAHTPIDGTVTVFLNGVRQDPNRWIITSGLAITFSVPPISIDFITVNYAY